MILNVYTNFVCYFLEPDTPNGIFDLKQSNEMGDLHALLTVREKCVEKLEAEISQLTAANRGLKEQVCITCFTEQS